MAVGIRGRGDPPPPALAKHGVPEPADPRGHLVEAAVGGMLAVGASLLLRARRPVWIEPRRLVAGRALHPDRDLRRRIVPVAQFRRGRLAVLAQPLGGAGRMVGDDHRRPRQGLHVGEGLDHPSLLVAGRVHGPGLELVEAALKVRQVLPLLGAVGDDDAGMVCARGVQLQAEEEDQVGDFPAGLQDFGVGEVPVHAGVVRSPVVRRRHPRQAVLAGHAGVGGDGVVRVAANHRLRRLGGIRSRLPVDAELGMDMVVARQPGPAIAMPVVSRARLMRQGAGGEGQDRGRRKGRKAGCGERLASGHGGLSSRRRNRPAWTANVMVR